MNLVHRILAALVVTGGTYGALYADAYYGTGWCFALIMSLLTLGGLREFYRMCRAQGWEPFELFSYVMAPLLIFGTEFWCLQKYHDLPRMRPDVFSTLIAAVVMGTIFMQLFAHGAKNTMGNIAGTLLGLIYVWFLPSFLVKMRHLGIANGWESDGVEFILVAIFVAKTSDVGGLLVGSQIGRHKLCPSISPKKTWEGTFGGIAFSIGTISLMAWSAPHGAIYALGWARIIPLGAVLAIASLLGDLVESAFKRDCQVKDAGASVPGFGGVLDLVDSLMVSAPAMYFYLIIFCGAEAGR